MPESELLSRRVAKILPDPQGLAAITAGKKIRLYQGFDPTGGHLHLGHTIGLRKLMEFARAGHEVIMLFGTGTVLVGDPSERDTGRKLITQEEIEENIKDWKRQVAPIVDFDLVTIRQNGDWLTKMTLKDIIHVASNISAVQLFKRENFTRRIGKGDTVWYHETMYPLLQGYDSVVMDVDLEIGGTDQEFNMLVGRELQRKMNNRDKFVLETPMILGTDGKTMSKTSGNCIFLDEKAEDMYTKLMAVQDDLVTTYFELLTDIPMEEIAALDPSTPVENKKKLAFDITRQFHGENGAAAAQKHFESVKQHGNLPESIEEFEIPLKTPLSHMDVLKQAHLPFSNSDIKRLAAQKGILFNTKDIITDVLTTYSFSGGEVYQIGKNTYRKVRGK